MIPRRHHRRYLTNHTVSRHIFKIGTRMSAMSIGLGFLLERAVQTPHRAFQNEGVAEFAVGIGDIEVVESTSPLDKRG
jgi:hypothetical protein